MSTAAVIGGGVVGLCSALALQRRGLRVTVIDERAGRLPASWGNAGHIAVEQVEPLASMAAIRSLPTRLFWRGGAACFPPSELPTWLPFGLRLLRASAPARFEAGCRALTALLGEATPAWRRLTRELGQPALLREQGHFMLWETEHALAQGRSAWREKAIGSATFTAASDAELAPIRALLGRPLAGGLRFDGTAQIADLHALREALESRFIGEGGVLDVRTVRRLDEVEADRVVLAAGVGSAPLLAQAGRRVPLVAERGHHIETADTDWPEGMPPLVFEDRSLILTRFASGLRAASFVEFSRADAPPAPAKWRRLHHHMNELGIAFPNARQWHGARPTLPDYLPAIGHDTGRPALIYAFGHQHLGLTLAPITGEIVAALATGVPLPLDLQPFSLARFGRQAISRTISPRLP